MFNEVVMICCYFGFFGGLLLFFVKLEIIFMIGIKCFGLEEFIFECNIFSLFCLFVSWWEEKKIGIVRVFCYNKSEGSGRYRILILFKFMKLDLIVFFFKVYRIIFGMYMY